mmetsp:Transcript_22090/g.33727  ORF Transcript_22090/g.33727 Transcript_22090/m.33727 type:complete len:207 (-) Transcript_22090:111-731(-)|eukprot:CAMPEP_0196812116 /NCGR_PEP_ID=MMETSP1362-20130617/20244_1 /TAXON_ID=163516 /ORGANISM="Leptocylindrus danicus, Strain CCMP1856" /LENGTH=206 /DNA_ID=CAMNT_0042187543 /DNA_START=115 /DNA_END=735 /DNA_ORIENTATION=-
MKFITSTATTTTLLFSSSAAYALVVPSNVNKVSSQQQQQQRRVGNNDALFAMSRRDLLRNTVAGIGGSAVLLNNLSSPVNAADSAASLISELETSLDKLATVPELLQAQKWDEARTVLKTPPVNYLWNMGDSSNTLLKLAKATDNFELIELKDELSLSIQMCDQLTYDNVFVYFQPGNGKVKVKEPVDLAVKANAQLTEAIKMAKE